jgi:quercetin dioxygenase-like cupin family protein
VIQPGETITNRVSGEQVTFLATAASTGGTLLAFETFFPAGFAGPPLHSHPYQEERFTVLDGTLHVTLAGKPQTLRKGETALVPAGMLHTFDNRQGAAVHFRVELRPALESEELFAGTLHAANQRGAATASLLQTAQLLHRFEIGLALAGVSPHLQRWLIAGLAAVGRICGIQIDSRERATVR